MDRQFKVFLVDDHPILRKGVQQIIESDPRIRIVGDAGDAESALVQIRADRPDVVLVDINLPGMNGLDLAEALHSLAPPVPVIILTMYNDAQMFNAALDRGVEGYLLKENTTVEVIDAIRAVGRGERYFSPAISGFLLQRCERAVNLRQEKKGLASLTLMERRVLKLVALNKTSKEIAALLSISPRTVDTHRANICSKLNLHGSHRLLHFALEHRSQL